MSSPDINNIILLGCIVVYTLVFFSGHAVEKAPVVCKVKVFVLMIGFSLVFGSLFAKMWRVYLIFMASKKLRKRAPKDLHLFIKIAIFTAINLFIVLLWTVIDPSKPEAIQKEHLKKADPDKDVMVIPVMWQCTSTYKIYFEIILVTIQGILLVFGVFLVFTTRKVNIPALNDSKSIGMCIYNVVVLVIVGLLVSVLMDSDVDTFYGIISTIIIVGTTSTQCLIFVPKVIRLRKYLAGDESMCSVRQGDGRSSEFVASYSIQTSMDATFISCD